MLFAEGNLPTPTYEQLGLFIVCSWFLFSVVTKVKQTWWSDGEKQIVARAELAERIALASRSIDELAEKHGELSAWAHESIHKLSDTLNGATVRLATLGVRQEETGKLLEKVSATCEENDRKLTRLLVLCEQWTVLKQPSKPAEKT